MIPISSPDLTKDYFQLLVLMSNPTKISELMFKPKNPNHELVVLTLETKYLHNIGWDQVELK
jgi:hypothetical protein